jgi:hypothetical protein
MHTKIRLNLKLQILSLIIIKNRKEDLLVIKIIYKLYIVKIDFKILINWSNKK